MSIRNLDALFEPRSIALIGASNRAGSVGSVLARNLFGSGFEGPVMPVNPRETSIRSAVCRPSLGALPMVPDLALVATPAAGVPALVPEPADPGDILGVVRLIADPDGERAEFGIMVRSDQKGRGLGRLLMQAILAYARRQGVGTVHGEVLAENAAMLSVARRLGFRQRVHVEDPGLRVLEIDLAAGAGT